MSCGNDIISTLEEDKIKVLYKRKMLVAISENKREPVSKLRAWEY